MDDEQALRGRAGQAGKRSAAPDIRGLQWRDMHKLSTGISRELREGFVKLHAYIRNVDEPPENADKALVAFYDEQKQHYVDVINMHQMTLNALEHQQNKGSTTTPLWIREAIQAKADDLQVDFKPLVEAGIMLVEYFTNNMINAQRQFDADEKVAAQENIDDMQTIGGHFRNAERILENPQEWLKSKTSPHR